MSILTYQRPQGPKYCSMFNCKEELPNIGHLKGFVRLTIIITVDSYVISQKHATCSSSWLSRSRSWHKVATCFLNFVDLRFFWIFCLALLHCIFHEAVTPTNIGCCTHLGKQKRVAVKYVNFTPSFYQKIKRRFCAVKKQIGTFLPVFPCVTIHVSFWLSCFSTVDSVSYVSLCVCFKVWLQG